jgi:hypothetical protein
MSKPTVDLARAEGMQAVVDAAMENSMFMMNNKAGPFAGRIAVDEAFRNAVLALDPAEYERIVHAYDDNLWGKEGAFMSVPEEFVPTIETPMLILPGSDSFHPTATAERICREARNAVCLAVDCRAPENLEATKQRVREFLRASATQGGR